MDIIFNTLKLLKKKNLFQMGNMRNYYITAFRADLVYGYEEEVG